MQGHSVNGRGSFTLSWAGAKACTLDHCITLPFFFSIHLQIFVPLTVTFPYKISLSFFFSPKSFASVLVLYSFPWSYNSLLLKQQSDKPKLASLLCNQTKTLGHGISWTLLLFIFVKFSLNIQISINLLLQKSVF